jgi:hypothetical protein
MGGERVFVEKVEFASDAWLEAAERVLKRAVAAAGEAIAGQRLTVCETFTDPPAHLRAAGVNEVAWSFAIDNGAVRVSKGAASGADYSVRADYHATLPGARTILGATPEAIEARTKARREAVASGRVMASGSLDHVSLAMRHVLIELHNRLAEITA